MPGINPLSLRNDNLPRAHVNRKPIRRLFLPCLDIHHASLDTDVLLLQAV